MIEKGCEGVEKEVLLRKMLAREQELRLSEAWQERFEMTENRADYDWLEEAIELQKTVVREFVMIDNEEKEEGQVMMQSALNDLRRFALAHPDLALQVSCEVVACLWS